MKEKFAEVLLGEDMSGTDKGVASALSPTSQRPAFIFGEHRKLPMVPDTKEP